MNLDVLTYKGALRVLVALGKAHPEPISMMDFTRAAYTSAQGATLLRQRLLKEGFIHLSRGQHRGAVQLMDIHLTPEGARLARHLVALQRENELIQWEADP